MKKFKFYLDFDGTITQNDVVDMMLERFADKSWQVIEKEWQNGKIGSRECLSKQIALLKASPEDLALLCQEIKIDDYFISFLKCADELSIPVRIVSDGFDYVIRQVLNRVLKDHPDLLQALPIFSNKIEWVSSSPKAIFSSGKLCDHGCANCKPEIIRQTASKEDMVLFVGDGLSDRYAVQRADISFAKGKLLQYCRDQRLNHVPYEHFGQVEEWLLKNYTTLKSN